MRATVMRRLSPFLPARRLTWRSCDLSESTCSIFTESIATPVQNVDWAARAGSVLRVFLGDDLVHLVGVGRGEETLAELGILEQPADAGERLQVHARGVLRGNQDEEDVGRMAVDGIEVDTSLGATDA